MSSVGAADPGAGPPRRVGDGGTGQGGGLKRRLGFWLVTLYGVGVMVGAGIYVLVGAVAGKAGLLAPASFVVAALVALPSAMSYAELAGRIPEAAGEAAYLRRATNRLWPGVLIGLTVSTTGVVSAAVVLKGGVGYLMALIGFPEPFLVMMTGLLLGATAIVGVLESLIFLSALTLIEVAGLVIVAVAGFVGPSVAGPLPDLGAAAVVSVGAGSLLAFFAFLGFEDMVNIVEETQAPARTLPRAIFAALGITTVLYLLVTVAAVRAVPLGELSESRQPLALVYERATGQSAAFLAAIAVAAALNGVLAQIVMAARVLYGLGRFAPAFKPFHKAHPRFGTPVLATLLAAGLAIAFALAAPIERLAEISASMLLVAFIAVNGSLVVLKGSGPEPAGIFVVPAIVPIMGTAGSLVILLAGLLT